MASLLSQNRNLKRVLVSISLANLCFMNLWIQLFTLGSPSFAYYTPMAPDWRMLPALLFDLFGLAAVLYLGTWLAARSNGFLKYSGLAVLGAGSIFALNEVRHLVAAELAKHFSRFYLVQPVLILAIFLAVWLTLRRGDSFQRSGIQLWSKALLIVSPLPFILALNLAWLYRAPVLRQVGPGHAAGMLKHPRQTAKRVIWIIFDEMDQYLAFQARPARIELPNFDRFLKSSFHAVHALPPGPETLYSIPALLTGRKVLDVQTRPTDLELRFAKSSGSALWSTQPNIFRQARAGGINTGISGWSHSYCRVLGGDLSSCFWAGYGGVGAFVAEDYLRDKSLLQRASYMADWQARSAPFLGSFSISEQPDEDNLFKRRQKLEYQAILGSSLAMLRNRNLGLLFIHVPTPHPEGIWDTRTQSFTMDPHSNYLDNLELADKTLGKFRDVLEAGGDWDRSAVLVSADHPFRVKLWRNKGMLDSELKSLTQHHSLRYVPFMLKLPGQKREFTYSREFNTVVSQALLWDILTGTVDSAEGVIQWLDDHSS